MKHCGHEIHLIYLNSIEMCKTIDLKVNLKQMVQTLSPVYNPLYPLEQFKIRSLKTEFVYGLLLLADLILVHQ